MRRNIGSASYIVAWTLTSEFGDREFPFVYLHDGTLSYSLTAYLHFQFSLGLAKNTSSLNDLFRTVAEIKVFYDAVKKKGEDKNEDRKKFQHQYKRWLENPQYLIIDYFEAKLYGTINDDGCPLGIFWKPTRFQNIKRQITQFARYEKFCQDHLNTESMNSNDVVVLATNKFAEFVHKSKYSLLGHLVDTSSIKGRGSSSYLNSKPNHGNEQIPKGETTVKYFPPLKVQSLIDETSDVNQVGMYLLCAFAGLRESEAVQVLCSDIVFTGEGPFPDVMLGHPSNSSTWCNQTKKLINRKVVLKSFCDPDFFQEKLSTTDLDFLRNPRPRFDVAGSYHAGWKTVQLIHPHDKYGYLLNWSNVNARIKFTKILGDLMKQRRANHPYLFCGPNGTPLKLPTYEKRLERKSVEITGESYGTHSLRHFCGFYLNNNLGWKIQEASIFMRHRGIKSTEMYFHTAPEKIRSELSESVERNIWEELNFKEWQ